MSYKIDEFIRQCNLTPLLKDYRKKCGDITYNNLKKDGFIKDVYMPIDLITLCEILCDFKLPEEPQILKKVYKAKRDAKDLRHWWLIKSFHNQKFVMQTRKDLGILFENRGFLINKDALKIKSESGIGLYESYDNMNFDFSPEFKDWFFRNSKNEKDFDEWEKASTLNYEIILAATNKILLKWKLPKRYERSIRELVLFNRIIPASSGIKWSTTRDSITGELQDGLLYDADITKEELINTIKEDSYHVLKNKKKHIRGSLFRSKRKASKIEDIINDYNFRKKSGKTDNLIFQELGSKYQLSQSGIRKAVKGR